MDTLDVMYAVTSSVIYLALTRFIDKTLQTAAESQTDPCIRGKQLLSKITMKQHVWNHLNCILNYHKNGIQNLVLKRLIFGFVSECTIFAL